MDIIGIGKNVLRTEAEAVSGLIERIDERFEKAVGMIFNSRGRVVVTGMGKSGIVGKKIAATLASTGTPAFFMHPAEASHGDLGMVTSDDVVVSISNSGETEELAALIPFLKRFNVGLIAMTGNAGSTIARAADVNLDVSVKEEACTLGVVPTASTTATLAMGDALAVALLLQRGFRKEDFALFHPRGSLGKKLFITVKDLMHSGRDLPLVPPDTPLMAAVIEISSKRLGIAVVAGGDRKILGVITDGDVRRGMERWGRDFFDMKAEEVMTKNPRGIPEEELAAKALSIMERHAITALVVPDSEDRICGVIHLHDILRQGIA